MKSLFAKRDESGFSTEQNSEFCLCYLMKQNNFITKMNFQLCLRACNNLNPLTVIENLFILKITFLSLEFLKCRFRVLQKALNINSTIPPPLLLGPHHNNYDGVASSVTSGLSVCPSVRPPYSDVVKCENERS